MTVITSPQNPAIKAIRALSEKKNRTDSGLFLAEGEKVLARARDLGWEPEAVLATGPVTTWGAARILTVTADVMASISGQKNPPPVAATFRQRWQTKVTERGLWIALDELRDPGNLGTILRTADAVGAAGVILSGNSADPYGQECVRATMGSIFALPLVRMGLDEIASLCRSWPGETVAAVVDGVLTASPRAIVVAWRRSSPRPAPALCASPCAMALSRSTLPSPRRSCSLKFAARNSKKRNHEEH